MLSPITATDFMRTGLPLPLSMAALDGLAAAPVAVLRGLGASAAQVLPPALPLAACPLALPPPPSLAFSMMMPLCGGGYAPRGVGPSHLFGQTNPIREMAHQAQVNGVLHDPALTVEDKVTLMLMLIMKKMDRDVENQAQHINAIQQQQSMKKQAGQMLGLACTVGGAVLGSVVPGLGTAMGAKLGGVVGGVAGQAAQGGTPSIDVETMKLKRMIDKRSQMFDMLRQIIDKYNETARGVIQAIGR